VISIDIGTTFTATSFCLLQPGKVPKFEEVLLFFWILGGFPSLTTPPDSPLAKAGKASHYGRHHVKERRKGSRASRRCAIHPFPS
jgi:hypothetical protein